MLNYLLVLILAQTPHEIPPLDRRHLQAIKAYDYADKPQPAADIKKKPPAEKPQQQPKKTPEYFFGVDKFGKRWKSLSESALRDKIQEINQLPWQLTDDDGNVWQHQDKDYLSRYVAERNANKVATQQFLIRWNFEQQQQQSQIIIPQYETSVICPPGSQ